VEKANYRLTDSLFLRCLHVDNMIQNLFIKMAPVFGIENINKC